MALAYPSIGSQYCFFGISQASSGNFQPGFVFSCCLTKDAKKLFPLLLLGSTQQTAFSSETGNRVWSRNRPVGPDIGLHCFLQRENQGCVRTHGEMLHIQNGHVGRDPSDPVVLPCPVMQTHVLYMVPFLQLVWAGPGLPHRTHCPIVP